jgi:GrpB-like predicted nucleotidyltransferase (UPF0157 family)
MTTPIIIEEYDPQWPKSFEAIRSRIEPAFGRFAAAIEHVGSTAVSGLAARPIIDIDVLLRSNDDLTRVIERLSVLGYRHEGTAGISEREAFESPGHDIVHHLYVCASDRQEFLGHLAVRDYLRRHPSHAEEYARLKRSLSGRFSIDRDAYTQAKSEFIEGVLRRARVEIPELFSRAHRTSN